MIRRIVPVVAAVALLGACSSNSTNMPAPGSQNTSRSDNRGPGGDGRGGRGGAREEMALRGITLSSDQRSQIDAIRGRYRSQMEASRQNNSNPDRSAMREMMEKQQAEVRAVLTTDQQAQYDRNIAEMRARMQQGGDRRPNG